jgi:RNA polymerase sigma-70 factor (ECF subfamily)
MFDQVVAAEAAFMNVQSRLFGLAYRMLGSRAEAEDVVQDVYVRWRQSDRDAIENPEAWLVTAATRRAIDRLRRLKTEREAYQGPWLPEPLIRDEPPAPDRDLELSSDLSIAFLVLLERLAPEERAAFLLHDVFDTDYRHISSVLEKSEAACRQIVHRARERVKRDQRRFATTEAAKIRLLKQFAAAVEARDEKAVLDLFAPDATWTADGGGRVHAAPRAVLGAPLIARLAVGLMDKFYGSGTSLHLVEINGETGLCYRVEGRLRSVLTIETDGTRILAAWVVVNPDKLPSTGRSH